MERDQMEEEEKEVLAYRMNSGSGPYSYSKNSTFQKKAIDAAKELISKAIDEKLDTNIFSSSNTFKLADLGCSVGPNTFVAVKNIIDAVEFKCQSQRHTSNFELPEFHVFYNDLASNDFNQLFRSLPLRRRCFAAGVPGSFRGRIFPSASLHFVHSSSAIHWLSKVPSELLDQSSPAWNKGRIYYSSSTAEVVNSYEAQFAKDMESFLKARAQEIIHGGLMVLIMYGRRNGTSHSEVYVNKSFQLLESSLLDMAKKGLITGEKIDSFNIPVYFASLGELDSAVKRNGCFSIEMIENIPYGKAQPKVMALTYRAALEGMVKEHFGDEISNELFDNVLYNKLEESSSITESCESVGLFILLKCTVAK